MEEPIRKILIASLLLSLLLVFAFTEKDANPEQITLNVFHYLDKSDGVATANFEEILQAFHKQNPNIKLEFDFLANEPYHNKLQAMNVSDQLPDLMLLWPGRYTGSVSGSGKIKDLRPWLKGHEDEFAPVALLPQGPNGEIYELPQEVTTTHVMYTNTKILRELDLTFPETLDELIAQKETIQNAGGYIPIAMANRDGWEMQVTLLSVLVERTAGRKWLEAAQSGDVSFSDPEFVNALAVIRRLSDEGMFSPGINQAEYDRAFTDFVTGKAAYFIDGGWRVPNIQKEAPKELQPDIELHAFPKIPNENENENEKGQPASSSIAVGTGFGMNAKLEGEKAEAAWKWIWFNSGPEAGKIKLTQGILPAYKMDATGLPILTQRLNTFLGNTPGGYVIGGIMDTEGMDVLNTGLQEMMSGDISPQELGEKYEAWVAENESARN